MADEIGRGVIVLTVDGSEVASGVAQVKAAIDNLVQSTTASGNKLASSMSGPARNMVSAFNQLSGAQAKQTSAYSSQAAAVDRLVASMNTAQATASKLASAQAAASASASVGSGNASANATAQLAAAAQNASSAVNQLGSAQQRQVVYAQAALSAMLQSANATQQQTQATQVHTAANQAHAASYGNLQKFQQAWVNSLQKEIIATNGTRDAVRTFEANLRQIPQSVYQPLIASLNAELAAKEANRKQEQQIAADNAYIQSLERKRDAIGKTTIELMRMEAAQRNMGNQAVAPGMMGPPAPSRAMGIINQIESRQAAQEAQAFVNNLEKKVQALQMASLKPAEQLRRSLLDLEKDAARLGVSAQSAPLLAALRNQAAAMDKGTMSAKQLQQALRLLPAQFTDIFTSIASGMPLWLVFIQQGGQIKDSFGGASNALKEVGNVFRQMISSITPLRALLTLLGGAAVAMASAWAYSLQSAIRETQLLRTTILNSGGVAGTSADNFRDMGRAIGATVGTEQKAVETLAAFAATGRATTLSIEGISKAALLMERNLSVSIKDSVKAFEELQKAPADASLKLNESTNYLTASVYAQIRALEESGRTQQAAAVATAAYFDEMTRRSGIAESQLGLIERGWRSVKSAIEGALDALRNFGKPNTAQEDVDSARKALENAEAKAASGRGVIFPGGRERQLEVLRERLRLAQLVLRAQIEEDNMAANMAAREQTRVQQKKAAMDLDKDLMKGDKKRKEEYIQFEIQKAKNETGENWKPEWAEQIRRKLDPPKTKETQENAGEKLLRELAGRREVLKVRIAELETQGKMTEAQKEYAKWESDVAILKAKPKKLLTDDQKEMLAKESEIRAAFQKGLTEDELKSLEAQKQITKEYDEGNLKLAERIQNLEKNVQLEDLIQKSLLKDAELQEKMMDNARALALLQWDKLRETDVSLQAEVDATRQTDIVKDQLEQRRKIEDEFYKERRKALQDYINGSINQEGYELQLQILDGYHKASLERWEKHYKDLEAVRRDPAAGVNKAIIDYIDEAENKFQQFGSLTEGVFRGLEDVMSDWVTSGKLSFTDFLKSFNAMVAKMMMQMLVARALQAALGISGGGNTAALGSGLSLGGSPAAEGMGGGTGLTSGGGGTGLTATPPSNWGGSYTGGGFDSSLTAKSSSTETPILVTQHITMGAGDTSTAPDRDQMRRMFKDGVRAGIAEARSRNSPVV